MQTSATGFLPLDAYQEVQGSDDGGPATDPFALDLRFVTDVPQGNPSAACDTEDGCAPTCASACVSDPQP